MIFLIATTLGFYLSKLIFFLIGITLGLCLSKLI